MFKDGLQLLPKDKVNERCEFYAEHNIGWVARPKHNPPPKKSNNNDTLIDESTFFVRKGKFKKASNMNFALIVSNKVEDKLLELLRTPVWSQKEEDAAYQECLTKVIEELNGKAWAKGNIRVGDYILLIDSDTRVPTDCLLDAASEMEASPEVAILQYSSGVMQVTDTFFEVRVFFLCKGL
jgi:cellulose synthase/poly-beta-1,6-N-acetylglucosamine synthase-like glycosyltransferase